MHESTFSPLRLQPTMRSPYEGFSRIAGSQQLWRRTNNSQHNNNNNNSNNIGKPTVGRQYFATACTQPLATKTMEKKHDTEKQNPLPPSFNVDLHEREHVGVAKILSLRTALCLEPTLNIGGKGDSQEASANMFLEQRMLNNSCEISSLNSNENPAAGVGKFLKISTHLRKARQTKT